MKNINLNPGGVIGGIMLMAAVIVPIVLTAEPERLGRAARISVLALCFGAVGGNYLWARVFRRDE